MIILQVRGHDEGTTLEFLGIGLVVLCAACLQGSIGFGLGMIAAPILVLLRPDLVPATLIIVATLMSVLALLRERAEVDWKLVLWAVLGRMPGSALGALAVTLLPAKGLSLFVAATVLIGVLFTAVGWTPLPRIRNILIASGFSGLFGTATSIGGPPVALVMRSFSPSQTRATLSAYFVFGGLLSLGFLALGGHVQVTHLVTAVGLFPFMLLGLACSSVIIRRVTPRFLFFIAISASAIGALLAIIGALRDY